MGMELKKPWMRSAPREKNKRKKKEGSRKDGDDGWFI